MIGRLLALSASLFFLRSCPSLPRIHDRPFSLAICLALKPPPSQYILLGQYWSNTNPCRLSWARIFELVQQRPKIGQPMFGSMLAGQSFESIPDLGPTVTKDWRPVYRLCWAAGLLPVCVILVQPWPRIGGQFIDICWPAGPLPVFLNLVQPWPKIAGQCIDLRWPACPS